MTLLSERLIISLSDDGEDDDYQYELYFKSKDAKYNPTTSNICQNFKLVQDSSEPLKPSVDIFSFKEYDVVRQA